MKRSKIVRTDGDYYLKEFYKGSPTENETWFYVMQKRRYWFDKKLCRYTGTYRSDVCGKWFDRDVACYRRKELEYNNWKKL